MLLKELTCVIQSLKPVFGSDIDGTLMDSEIVIEGFFCYLRKQGIPYNRRAYRTTHSWDKAVPGQNVNQLYKQFVKSGQAPLPAPMPGARQAVETIAAHFHVHLVTARNKYSLKQIGAHVTSHIFTTAPCQNMWHCGGRKKKSVLTRIRAILYVDDSRTELEALIGVRGLHLIQFPSFLASKVPHIRHPQVTRLKACDLVGEATANHVRELAWQEVTEIALNTIPS